MIRRLRRFWMQLWFTVDFLNSWGERATPGAIRFAWSYCKEDFEKSLQAAIDAGDIPEGKY